MNAAPKGRARRPRPRRPQEGPTRLVGFNKPMNMLSQFTDEGQWPGLGQVLDLPGLYPAGRLDRDSEGLLLLTNDGALQAQITAPKMKWPKTYLVLVEGLPAPAALDALRAGVLLKDGPTRAAKLAPVPPPDWLWPRTPPVRLRKTVPDQWLEITLTEGRNRQIRRMCAHVGHPVLRLVRTRIGPHGLDRLAPGQWRDLDPSARP